MKQIQIVRPKPAGSPPPIDQRSPSGKRMTH